MEPPFFRLPQELRDHIYIYVLHEPKGVIYVASSDGSAKLRTGSRPRSRRGLLVTWLFRNTRSRTIMRKIYNGEVNQLKYVCKQLYNETRGLETSCNTITFDNPTNAVEHCTTFLHSCPSLHSAAIKCSIQSFRETSSKGRFGAIEKHCMTHPNTLVKIYIPYWSQADPRFISIALFLLSNLRNRSGTDLVYRLAQLTMLSGVEALGSGAYPKSMQIPHNMRLFPIDDQFNRSIFEQSCQKHETMALPTTRVEMKEILDIVESWFDFGL